MSAPRKKIELTEEVEQPTDFEALLAWIQQLVDDVPPEAWDDTPTDGSINHDHYLYGLPKQQP